MEHQWKKSALEEELTAEGWTRLSNDALWGGEELRGGSCSGLGADLKSQKLRALILQDYFRRGYKPGEVRIEDAFDRDGNPLPRMVAVYVKKS